MFSRTNLRFLLGAAVLLGTLPGKPLHAAVVVDFSGTAYVESNQSLNLPTATIVGSTRIWTYSDSAAIQPTTGYTHPPGKSAIFYGGSYLTRSESDAGWSQAQIFDHANGDRINYNRQGAPGITYSGAIFTAFLKPNFLNDASSQTVAFGLNDEADPVGSLSLNITGATGATYRFAVLNDGQWYLSSATATATGAFTLSAANILNSDWGLWGGPNAGADGRLANAPGSFTTAKGEDFTDIQGFGYYVSLSGAAGGAVTASINSFVVDALVVPEPSTVGMLLGLGGLMLMFRRRSLAE